MQEDITIIKEPFNYILMARGLVGMTLVFILIAFVYYYGGSTKSENESFKAN